MKVRDCMTTEVHACRVDETLNEVADRFWKHDCGWLPVLDSRDRVVGAITDRDACLGAHFRGRALHEIPVAETMSRRVETVLADEDVATAAARLADTRLRRLPVVDPGGAAVGVFGLVDLARAAASAPAAAEREELDGEVLRVLAAVTGAAPAPAPEVLTPRAGATATKAIAPATPKAAPATPVKKKAPAKKRAGGARKKTGPGRAKKS